MAHDIQIVTEAELRAVVGLDLTTIDIIEQETDIWQIAQRIMRYVNTEFRYEPNSTHVHSTRSRRRSVDAGALAV